MAATSAHHKDNIDNVRAFKIMKKQDTIKKLRDEVRKKKSEATSLKVKVKTVLHRGAQEKEVMRNKHWKEKRLLHEKKKELEKAHAERMNTKTEKISSLKKQYNNDISELKLEMCTTNRDGRDLKQMKVAKESLACNGLESLRKIKSLLSKQKLELDSKSSCQAEVEETLSDLQVKINITHHPTQILLS